MALTRNTYQRNTSWNAPYTFSGKEKDVETGYGYVKKLRFFSSLAFGNEKQVFHYAHCLCRFGARYYDSGLSIWLSVDPMSDKYPSMSPYNYCANNPVMLVDPDGRDLDVSGNIQKSTSDILSLVSSSNSSRVIIDQQTGRVSINRNGLSSEDISNDKGLSLIIEMVDSRERFLFESTNETEINFTGTKWENNQSVECIYNKPNYDLEKDDNGVVNASVYGKDSKNKNILLPRGNYHGQVSIAISREFEVKSVGGYINNRKSVIYHELKENLYRTKYKFDFLPNLTNGNYGAHQRSADDEGGYFGNETPGIIYK